MNYLMNIKVKKRDGSIENYDPGKMIRVVKAAGLTEEEAQQLGDAVTAELTKREKSMVTSVQIRDSIIVEIQKINKTAANKFIWYEKQRDKDFGLS